MAGKTVTLIATIRKDNKRIPAGTKIQVTKEFEAELLDLEAIAPGKPESDDESDDGKGK